MVLELSNGTYLHTAYAVSNIAEEFTAEDWSLTSQEGMNYIGTYVDGSSTDSTDPTVYNWEELLDTAIDDTDSDGEMPVADYQAQIDALQDQVSILQTDKETLETSIENNAGNVATASELSSSAQDLALEANQVAQATGQHFWSTEDTMYFLSTDTTVNSTKTYYSYDGTDYTAVTPAGTEDPSAEGWYEALGTGAYVTAQTQEEFKATPTGKNSLWNSLGMLFRTGLNNLLAILAGGSDGTGPKGIAIYDGAGNEDSNIIAQFTDSGAEIGANTAGQTLIKSSSMVITDDNQEIAFAVYTKDQEIEETIPYYYPDFSIGDGAIIFTEPTSLTIITINALVFQTNMGQQGVKGPLVFTRNNKEITVTVPSNFLAYVNYFKNEGVLRVVSLTNANGNSRLLCGSYPKDDATISFAVGGGNSNNHSNNFTVETGGVVTAAGSITAEGHSSPIGTVIDSYLASTKSVANNTWTNLCSITLSTGQWIVNCLVRFPQNATGKREANCGTTSADSAINITQRAVDGATTQMRFVKIFQPTSTTTYYLNCRHNAGSALTMPAGGVESINAIRAIRIA